MADGGGAAVAGRNPVLLVHGIFDSGRAMQAVRRSLKRHGWSAVYTIDLQPNDASDPLEKLAQQLDGRVEELCRMEQVDHLDLVAFSMGGLVARYYLKHLGGLARVDHLVTISSPHHGTQLALLSSGAGAQQMRPGSEFLKELNDGDETPGPVRYTCIWTPLDLMIVPPDSSRLAGAHNVSLWSPAHPAMLWDRRVFKLIREALVSGG
jgi:triacylglycerol lipase